MILILDFGSQYTQLIARRLRDLEVFCEILPFSTPLEEIRKRRPKGLILSGGPASVYHGAAPRLPSGVLGLGVPVLGICYGMQLLAQMHGGKVRPAPKREYGHATLSILEDSPLFEGLPRSLQVWMSHGDGVLRVTNGIRRLAQTPTAPLAAIACPPERWWGVQFHPEVAHTPLGSRILENFSRRICRIEGRWTAGRFIQDAVRDLRAKIGPGRVLLALSGGVDSSVAALLLHKAVGDQLTCVFVDHGLQRKGESERVRNLFVRRMGMRVRMLDASRRFLARLKGVADPERKRKIIGSEFVRTFEAEARKIGKVEFLAQGTLYPDVIESVSVRGPSATIKTHHNVGGLPKRMRLALVEPLRTLFKDEVRKVGLELGLPEEAVLRHPFPGPSLAIRILGSITPQRLSIVREADAIVEQEMRAHGLYEKVWQAFAVLLPVRTVGVMGDERTYENVAALRVVESHDGMTADWVPLPADVLRRISGRIVSEVKGINRVVYDITSKPPGTIEWE